MLKFWYSSNLCMRDDDMIKILTLAGGAALKVPPPPPTPKPIAVLLNPRKLNSVLVLRIPSLRETSVQIFREKYVLGSFMLKKAWSLVKNNLWHFRKY